MTKSSRCFLDIRAAEIYTILCMYDRWRVSAREDIGFPMLASVSTRAYRHLRTGNLKFSCPSAVYKLMLLIRNCKGIDGTHCFVVGVVKKLSSSTASPKKTTT